MRLICSVFMGLAAFFLAVSAPAAAEPELFDPKDKVPDTPYEVRGWLEHGRIMPQRLLLDAKLDSGAKTTSIDAEIIDCSVENVDSAKDCLDRDTLEEGDSVVFRVTNEDGESTTLRRKVVRWVDIKSRGDGVIARPVVEMTFCIAGLWVEGEVNLSDRTGFNYPLLVGRNMLQSSNILIDARETYTYRAKCDPRE